MENNETNVPRIIAMANMKGGVGKTTSTICTAIALNKLGRKVEVRDIDPQGSATLWAAKARAAGEQPGGARHHTRPSRPRPYVGDG